MNISINEEEFRRFITDIDELVNYQDNRDITPVRLLAVIDKYKDRLNSIDHNSSSKFKQLKINYGKDKDGNACK